MCAASTKRQPRRALVAIGTATMLVSSLLAGCGVFSQGAGGAAPDGHHAPLESVDGGPTLSHLRQTGVMHLGVIPGPPYSDIDPKTGNVTGAYADVVRIAMQDLGVGNITGIPANDFGSLIPGLQAGQWDTALALTVTPQRCDQILFGSPLDIDPPAFATKPNNPLGFRSYADVAKNPKVRVAVLPGSAEEQAARAAGMAGSQIVTVPDLLTGLEAIDAGRADYVAAANTGFGFLKTPIKFQTVILEGGSISGSGIGFRKSDEKLRDAFNQALAGMQHDGRFQQIMRSYGFPNPDLAAQTSLQQLVPTCH